MAALKKHKTIRSWGADPEWVEIEYDFSKDAGAQGALDVLTVKDACVVLAAYFNVDTEFAGTNATLSLGVSGSAAALMAATATSSMTAGASIDGASIGTTYKLAANAVVIQTIATADITAGKGRFRLLIAKF